MENSRTVQHAKAPLEKPKEAMFLYSVPTTVFLFDVNLKLLQKIKVANPEAAIAALTKGEWLYEETAAVKKAIGDGKAVVVLGFKKGKMADISLSQDAKKLAAASSAADEELKKLRDVVISFTKKAVSESVSDDNLIIQASSSIGDINKAISLLIKRVREWYGLYNPEFSESCIDNEEFARAVAASSQKPSPGTMGGKLAKGDADKIVSFAIMLESLYNSRKSLSQYVETLMQRHCPNIAAVADPSTGAELIAQAGSLQRLAMLPSSTIQLLGAERELFKHLKDNRQKPPKAGVLHSHPLVTAAPKQQQGRIAKLLADKISIAARVDYFKGKFVGDSLLSDLKKRLQERAASTATSTATAGKQK